MSCVANVNRSKKVLSETSSRAKELEKLKYSPGRDFSLQKVEVPFSDFFFVGEKPIGVSVSIFLHEVMFKCFLAANYKGTYFEFFVQKVVRGNAVQIFPNFPAKRLSIYRRHFLVTPF